jgi:hypothetical protein
LLQTLHSSLPGDRGEVAFGFTFKLDILDAKLPPPGDAIVRRMVGEEDGLLFAELLACRLAMRALTDSTCSQSMFGLLFPPLSTSTVWTGLLVGVAGLEPPAAAAGWASEPV